MEYLDFSQNETQESYLAPSPGHQRYVSMFETQATQFPPGARPTPPAPAQENCIPAGQGARDRLDPALSDTQRQMTLGDSGPEGRQINIDYVFYSRAVLPELPKTSRRTSASAKKEWDRYTPVGDKLYVWNTILASHTWEEVKSHAINLITKGRANFAKLVESELNADRVKWQLIIAGSRIYGAKKNVYAASEEDFKDFVRAVYDTMSSKVIIKLFTEDPSLKAKEIAQERSMEENLTLTFGDDVEKAPLERQRARLTVNSKADTSQNPVTPVVADLMARIKEIWGHNEERLWIGNPYNENEAMQITHDCLHIWARAIVHNTNPEVDLDNPPNTKDFVWVNKHVTRLADIGKRPVRALGGIATGLSPTPLSKEQVRPPACTSVVARLANTPGVTSANIDKLSIPAGGESDIEIVDQDINNRQEDLLGTPSLVPSSFQSPANNSRDGSPARKYVRSPSGDNIIGEAIRKLTFQRPTMMLRSESISPTRKQPSSVFSAELQKPRKISAAGKAMSWDEFLTHCNFAPSDLVVRGMIQLNHIPHWSNFLTTSVVCLQKMNFPLSVANQIMYGTQTLSAEYFE